MSEYSNQKSPILLISGFLISVLFIFNTAFGNASMNVISFGLPLNQLLIGSLLILFLFSGLLKIPNGSAFFLYAWIFFSFFIWLPIGFAKHGLLAGRDATQVIDATIFILAFSIISRINTVQLIHAINKVLFIALSLEFLDRVFLFLFDSLSVSSLQSVNLFGGAIGSHVVIIASLWFGILTKGIIPSYSTKFLIYTSILLVLLHQTRFLYLALVFSSFMFFYLNSTNFLSKSFLKKILTFILLLFLFEIIISFLIPTLIAFNFSSEYLFSDRLFKFGIESFSLSGILDHLSTGFGFESEVYAGSSYGVYLRIEWWERLFSIMFSDLQTLLFGIGYGVPLTPDTAITAIREPHNSYISVFCRNGLFLFFIWFIFHFLTFFKGIKVLKKEAKHTNEYKLLFVSFLTASSTYIAATVQPAFELPPIAITTYITLAISISMISRINFLKKYENSQL